MLCRIVAADETDLAPPAPWVNGGAATGSPAVSLPFTYEPTVRPDRTATSSAAGPQPGPELEARVREARHAGYVEGEAAGKRLASEELRPVLERLGRSIAELENSRSTYLRQTETDVVRLALAVARRILHRELTIDPDATAGLVKAALEKLQSDVVAQARVHPDYEASVRSVIGQSGRRASVEVVADASLERGDVVLETNRGNLDASIETQLREIELGFADRFRRPYGNAAAV
jgi:flagellar assembly protein FliH